MNANPLRNIPSINDLLESPPLRKLVDRLSHSLVVESARSALDELRNEIYTAASEKTLPSLTELAERIARRVTAAGTSPFQVVINASGTLLHPTLGGPPLPRAAIEAMADAGRDYTSSRLDLTTGKRTPAAAEVESLLRELTGAEAARVVNSGQAATLLALTALAAGREVVVARGDLFESADGLRPANLLAAAGALAREVGTVNKTRAADYEEAVTPATAALLVVHAADFALLGLTGRVPIEQVVEIGRRRDVPVLHDLQAGTLIEFGRFGLHKEPGIKKCLAAGVDLVLCGGDRLVGGPRCGWILGRRELVARIEQHPMARAFSVDTPILAALAATLRLYRDASRAVREIPLLSLLDTSVDNLRNRAQRLAPQMAAAACVSQAEGIDETTYLADSPLPDRSIPTYCISLAPKDRSVARLAAALRTGRPAVVARQEEERLLLDLRTVMPRQDIDLVEAVTAIGE